MASIYGDESSSAEKATYGLLAISDADLPALAMAVKEAKAFLKSDGREPLHCRVLFHADPRRESSFKNASPKDVETACSFIINKLAEFKFAFYFAHADRISAPKTIYVPAINHNDSSEVFLGTMDIELGHLQYLSYVTAAIRACNGLSETPRRLIVDESKTVIRWFNERKQTGRLLASALFDTPNKWPAPIFAKDQDHPALQVVDILTYYATRQFKDNRFAMPLNPIRANSYYMTGGFAPEVCRPYVPPPGVTVIPMQPKR